MPEDLEIFPKLKDEPGQSRFAVSRSRGAGAEFALAAKRGTGQGAKTTAGVITQDAVLSRLSGMHWLWRLALPAGSKVSECRR